MNLYVNGYKNLYKDLYKTNWNNIQTKTHRLNIIEKSEEYLVEMEMPGFGIKDIEIKLEKHILKIASKKLKTNEIREDKKIRYLLNERLPRKFDRSLVVGSDVNEKDLSANLKNGLLTITLPKQKKQNPRSIDILAG